MKTRSMGALLAWWVMRLVCKLPDWLVVQLVCNLPDLLCAHILANYVAGTLPHNLFHGACLEGCLRLFKFNLHIHAISIHHASIDA